MKKAMILLAVTGVVLPCVGAVFAGAEKTVFLPEPWTSTVEGGIHANANGFVIVQTTKGGGATVSVQLRKAAPGYTYVVKSNGKVLGTFRTDAKGNGVLQLYVPDPSTTLGRWINIWQTAGLPDHSDWNLYGLLYGPRW
jgi:hypothetical protein